MTTTATHTPGPWHAEPIMKNSRVTISAGDALIAFTALRASIRDTDVALATYRPDERDCSARLRTAEWRAEQVAAYERIAKTLGLKPTLDVVANAEGGAE